MSGPVTTHMGQEIAEQPAALRATIDSLLPRVGEVTSLARQTLDNIRVLSQQLRPGVLDDLGLLAALRWLAEDSHPRLQLDVTLSIDDAFKLLALPAPYETALFRIAQECLTNVARHAQARHVELILQKHSEGV